jgi:hypothetical protein
VTFDQDQHGRITLLERPALERLYCECYAVVKKETDRLRPLHGKAPKNDGCGS